MQHRHRTIWNSCDPQSLNRYTYVRNNPVRNTDPTGHDPRDQWYHAIWAATTGSSQGTSGGSDDDGGTGKLIDSGSHGYVRPYVSDLKGLARKLVGESTSGDKEQLPEPGKVGREEVGPITAFIRNTLPLPADVWSGAALGLNAGAWLTDTLAAGGVVLGAVAGAGATSPAVLAGAPEVPVATGLAGAAMAEVYVQPALALGNLLSAASTVSTFVASAKSGRTEIENLRVGNDVLNSACTTAVGVVDREAVSAWVVQSVSMANSLGWRGIPFGK